MSDYNLIWRRYGLSANPYQTNPITMSGESLGTDAFIGREREREELKKSLRMGTSQRIMVTGDPGIGKTSLVNFVREDASESGFFTPRNEIELEEKISKEKFMLLTLSNIFSEIQGSDFKLSKKLKEDLGNVYEMTQRLELSEGVSEMKITSRRLKDLTKRVLSEISEEYSATIIHYDNLDNIDDVDEISKLLNGIRDYLQMPGLISIFVGDEKLSMAANKQRRVDQIFQDPIEVGPFNFSDVQKVLNKRIDILSDEEAKVTVPHTKNALETLYNLHDGNIRDILNSLQTSVKELPETNTSVRIREERMRGLLYTRINESLLQDLSNLDKKYLETIMENEPIYPAKLGEFLDKGNGSPSVYINRLKEQNAVRESRVKDTEEGRRKFYEVTPRVHWINLKEKGDKFEDKTKISDFTE